MKLFRSVLIAIFVGAVIGQETTMAPVEAVAEDDDYQPQVSEQTNYNEVYIIYISIKK